MPYTDLLTTVLESEVLLVKEDKILDNDEETWADCVIDLKDISAIRRCMDEDKKDCAVIHFKHGDYFIVKSDYDSTVKHWKHALTL